MFDIEKVPFYNVPDLTDFKLRPYVAHATPKVDPEKAVASLTTLDEQMIKTIHQQIDDAHSGKLMPSEEAGDMKSKQKKRR